MNGRIRSTLSALRQRWLLLLATALGMGLLAPKPVPDAFRFALEQATVALQADRPGAAAEALDRALVIEPELPALQRLVVELSLDSGQPERALELIDRWNVDGAACLRQQANLQLADPSAAAALLAQGPPGCRPDPTRLQALATEATAAGDLPTALSLEQAQPDELASDPTHLERVALLSALIDPNLAVPALRQALAAAPADRPLLRELIRAIEERPLHESEAFLQAQMGQALAREERWFLARAAFERAVALEPDYPEAKAFLGLALERTGRDGSDLLVEAYRQAPSSPITTAFLGLHWLEAGQPDQALPLLAQAARLDAANPALRAQVGAAYAAAGDYQAALDAYSRAAALAPQDASFWHLLAEFSLAHEIDVAGTGLPAARRALALDPSAANADVLGYAHFLHGSYDLAARLLDRSLQLDAGRAETLYHRGLLALELGDRAGGREWLRQAQAADPEGPYGELAARALARFGP